MAPHPSERSDTAMITTTIFISNLHCLSCVDSIEESLRALELPPQSISHSIVSHSIFVRHKASLPVKHISEALELAGFEVHSVFQDQYSFTGSLEGASSGNYSPEWENSLEQAVSRWRQSRVHAKEPDMDKRRKHVEQCKQCKAESKEENRRASYPQEIPLILDSAATASEKNVGTPSDTGTEASSPITDSFIIVNPPSMPNVYKATLSLSGMTCSACVSGISHNVGRLPWVRSVDVNLLTSSGTVIFHGKDHTEELVSTIEDLGFEASLESVEEIQTTSSKAKPVLLADRWRATYSVGGMTCSACTGNISNALRRHSYIENVDVNLLSNSATIVFSGKDHLSQIQETIEDAGYDATLDNVINVEWEEQEVKERSMSIRIDGIYCHHCPPRIINTLSELYGHKIEFEDPLLAEKTPILRIKYVPDTPTFTIRHITESVAAIDPAFKASIYHPPTIEERARDMHARERQRILFRLCLSIIVAIPTFIIGIVYMDLVSKSNKSRQYLMQPTWVGNVSRTEWILFIMATPVYFFAADTFHVRALKEIRAMWRPGSRTPFLQRFYRFGSMNMLMSLGTSIAYFASIAGLARAATRQSSGALSDSYFDSVVFLTMFILIGRFLEAYSKAKTGDAVTSLGKLRPDEAILIDSTEQGGRKVSADLLEIGDIVRVPHGTSPPFDAVVLEGTTTFDESSLTGESRPVSKASGDTVYSGTINKGGPITVRITTVSGTSMLDQIISVVREGQTRRAPVERAADIITSHFVPFVVFVAIVTWLVWLGLGMSGTLPNDWRDASSGAWPLWSLRFAIAVFVIACPCGIGLAAPTALFVGGGLAAKHGILVKGGGEAFQEASSLNCIVFDKTGTLTQGDGPVVTEYEVLEGQAKGSILGMVKQLEESSSHPVAKAIVSFCNSQSIQQREVSDVDEVPGKGLKGYFTAISATDCNISVIIGNEAFMADHQVPIPLSTTATLELWKSQGKSVALAAINSHRRSDPAPTHPPQTSPRTHAALFAIADPLRPEAASTIAALRSGGLDVWMLSGDNPTTARAVGAMVGIPPSNIIAGVLPDQKAAKIQYLQRALGATGSSRRSPLIRKRGAAGRANVAMVGDGINDAPALAAADVSIAVGSGSDVALSSASFVLVASDLRAVLTLLALSRAVFRRVCFNFGWALVYNLLAMPIAAGVLYPIRTGAGMHVRLDPVWASLAMALSSVSVVCSSLLLRSGWKGVGFRVREVGEVSEK